MRKAFVTFSKEVFNALYRTFNKGERRDEVVFLSRQADEPSYDYRELAREFEARGWQTTMHLKKVTKRNLPSYTVHVVNEIKLLARCKIAVLDRYDPVISLIDFECERPLGFKSKIHDEFPTQPVIIQLWHAFGAFKKFGYQSIGTREGHSEEVVDTFNIHRNYSWVVCSGEGVRQAFGHAFSYPVERVVALDRPEYDELAQRRAELDVVQDSANGYKRKTVLMAPTLRKSKASEHPFRNLFDTRSDFEESLGSEVVWAFHPLESGLPAPGNASDDLIACDLVVTDYSSTVFEAYLLGKPVVFFVPDLESYLKSPGLNVNPYEICPHLCAFDASQLTTLIGQFLAEPASYPFEELEAFCSPAFSTEELPVGVADDVIGAALANGEADDELLGKSIETGEYEDGDDSVPTEDEGVNAGETEGSDETPVVDEVENDGVNKTKSDADDAEPTDSEDDDTADDTENDGESEDEPDLHGQDDSSEDAPAHDEFDDIPIHGKHVLRVALDEDEDADGNGDIADVAEDDAENEDVDEDGINEDDADKPDEENASTDEGTEAISEDVVGDAGSVEDGTDNDNASIDDLDDANEDAAIPEEADAETDEASENAVTSEPEEDNDKAASESEETSDNAEPVFYDLAGIVPRDAFPKMNAEATEVIDRHIASDNLHDRTRPAAERFVDFALACVELHNALPGAESIGFEQIAAQSYRLHAQINEKDHYSVNAMLRQIKR